jgi:hypothetical protein
LYTKNLNQTSKATETPKSTKTQIYNLSLVVFLMIHFKAASCWVRCVFDCFSSDLYTKQQVTHDTYGHNIFFSQESQRKIKTQIKTSTSSAN